MSLTYVVIAFLAVCVIMIDINLMPIMYLFLSCFVAGIIIGIVQEAIK